MKVILDKHQIAYILKYKKVTIDNKIYKFDRKAMTKLRKLIKQKNAIR